MNIDDFDFTGDEICGEDQWREFFSGMCWKEILDTIKMRLSITRSELEVCSLEEIGFKQGEAKTLRFMLDMEQIVIGSLKKLEEVETDG